MMCQYNMNLQYLVYIVHEHTILQFRQLQSWEMICRSRYQLAKSGQAVNLQTQCTQTIGINSIKSSETEQYAKYYITQ